MKLAGVVIVTVSIFLFFLQWEIILDSWYRWTVRADLGFIPGQFVAIGRGVFYVSACSASVMFGLLLMIAGREPGMRVSTIALITIGSIAAILELPVYACKFGAGRHSYWNSRTHHFH